jgi:hypothetical protein
MIGERRIDGFGRQPWLIEGELPAGERPAGRTEATDCFGEQAVFGNRAESLGGHGGELGGRGAGLGHAVLLRSREFGR